MNPREITDIKVLQDLVIELLNRVDQLTMAHMALQEQLAEAQDEINRLKGEQGRPRFPKRRKSPKLKAKRPASKPAQKDSTSEESASPPAVDECVEVKTPPANLPADAVFKGYRSVYQHDIQLARHNTEYKIARWYSPSEGKVYESSLPPGAVAGIGSSLRSFIQILHHGGDMTHRKISELLDHLGIELSSGTISEVLTRSDWVEAEYEALFPTCVGESPYVQMDSTASRQQGKGMHTQVMCGEFFSLFSTQQGRSRADVYAALQGQSREEVQLAYTPLAIELMERAKVSIKHRAYFAQQFELGAVFSFETLEQHLDTATVFAKTNQKRRSAIAGALAAGYYHQQEAIPKVNCLLTDDAREYQKVATEAHLHCWIHAIRHYRKMSPNQAYLRTIHQDFLDRLWVFYDQLRIYQKPPPDKPPQTKAELIRQFDQLFDPHTDYQQLNKQISLTLEKRDDLLRCLEYPAIPLHNNAAERAARRVVRKRNISLHTWSKRGTRMRDAFMSLHQTAKKLGIKFLDYLKERNAGIMPEKTIAQLVQQRYRNHYTTTF
ncbi:MAG: transposase [Bacteroidota bacterium]